MLNSSICPCSLLILITSQDLKHEFLKNQIKKINKVNGFLGSAVVDMQPHIHCEGEIREVRTSVNYPCTRSCRVQVDDNHRKKIFRNLLQVKNCPPSAYKEGIRSRRCKSKCSKLSQTLSTGAHAAKIAIYS